MQYFVWSHKWLISPVQPYQEVSPGKQGLRGFWNCRRPVSDTASHHLWLYSHINPSRLCVYMCEREADWLTFIYNVFVYMQGKETCFIVFFACLQGFIKWAPCFILVYQHTAESPCALYCKHRVSGQAIRWLTSGDSLPPKSPEDKRQKSLVQSSSMSVARRAG